MVKFTLSALLFATAVAGAQTVTVGSTTSTQNGTTTTITVPVSVAVPAASTLASATMASLRVEAGDGNGGPTNQTLGTSFKTIALPRVVTDTASGWNASANTYTIPVTGTYLVISNLRLADAAPAGISYGQGANTSNVDNPSFLWSTTSGPRNGFINVRTMQLSAGQTVDLFAYADSTTPIGLSSAALSIQQLN